GERSQQYEAAQEAEDGVRGDRGEGRLPVRGVPSEARPGEREEGVATRRIPSAPTSPISRTGDGSQNPCQPVTSHRNWTHGWPPGPMHISRRYSEGTAISVAGTLRCGHPDPRRTVDE